MISFAADRSIAGRFGYLRAVVEAGVLTPEQAMDDEYRALTKAYRLKEYGRCPACDEPGVCSEDLIDTRTQRAACGGCGWQEEIAFASFVKAEHVDDPIVDLCRKVSA